MSKFPSPFRLRRQILPWDCLYWVMARQAGTTILAKSFTTPESPSSFTLGTLENFVPVSEVETAEELLRRVQNGCSSVHNTPRIFSTRPSISASSGWSNTTRPKFRASTVALTRTFAPYHCNVKLHFQSIVELLLVTHYVCLMLS
jgi:hypothetical protein